MVHHLIEFVPATFGDYWEPFLGAGALFFKLSPEVSFLSDMNKELVDCFRYVQENPNLIHRYLREHSRRTCEDYYYKVRVTYNRSLPSAAQAARFIYLNKTGFNGIYRVNLDGDYNVPYGKKEPPVLPSLVDLRLASKALSNAQLRGGDFKQIMHSPVPQEGDFVYLDPPYPPLNDTAFFTHCTTSRFSWDDQKHVSEIACDLDKSGAKVMISNADLGAVRELYYGWNFYRLPVLRSVAANGSRKKSHELVITNYGARLAS